VALVLSGAGLTVGLVFDLFGHRRRFGRLPVAHGAVVSAAAMAVGVVTAVADAARAEDGWERDSVVVNARAPLVGGLDGCRRGWVLVLAPRVGHAPSVVQVVTDLVEVLALLDADQVGAVGVDIPIGLPLVGPRRCDVAARRRLGRRGSSVFPAPPRALFGSDSYDDAVTRSRAVCGKGISVQAFGILPKVEAVDRLMTPDRQYSVVEVHPELSFTLLAGHPMHFRKACPEGKAERLDVLREVFPDVDDHLARPLPGARPDDVLDAFAAAWSAARWLSGTYERFGGELDGRGLRMEIIA